MKPKLVDMEAFGLEVILDIGFGAPNGNLGPHKESWSSREVKIVFVGNQNRSKRAPKVRKTPFML